MLPSTLVLLSLLWALDDTPSPTAAIVTLTNGREQRALRVERDAGTVLLHFREGTLRVPASEVAKVTEDEPVPAAYVEIGVVTFALGDTMFESRLPNEYQPVNPQPEPAVVTYVAEGTSGSVRFAWSDLEHPLWSIPEAVRRHHSDAYADYEVRSERFMEFASHPAWLLTFSYRRGPHAWLECQGFLELRSADRILVVSAAARADADEQGPEWIVRMAAASLQLDEE